MQLVVCFDHQESEFGISTKKKEVQRPDDKTNKLERKEMWWFQFTLGLNLVYHLIFFFVPDYCRDTRHGKGKIAVKLRLVKNKI